jgi:hypothetical protein
MLRRVVAAIGIVVLAWAYAAARIMRARLQ